MPHRGNAFVPTALMHDGTHSNGRYARIYSIRRRLIYLIFTIRPGPDF